MRTIYFPHLATLFFLVVTFSACNPPAQISGTIDGVETDQAKVYLIQPVNLREMGASYLGAVVDSALIDANGWFEFTKLPETNTPVLYELAVQPDGKFPSFLETENPKIANYMPILWQTGQAIEISANYLAFQKSFKAVHPSDVNQELLKLRDVNLNAYEVYFEAQQWDVEDGNQLMAKEHATMQYQEELMNFAVNSTHFIPSMVALRWVSPVNDYERVPEFLVDQCAKWKDARADHPWTAQLCAQGHPEKLPVLIGSPFPNLRLPMMTNDTLQLSELLGNKLTIIDLWASWCAPCRIENKEVLVPLWNAYSNQGLQIIGYSLESNAAGWIAASKKDGADQWPQASELQGDDTPILHQIRVRTIPANFILDHQGVVLAKNIHGQELKDWVKNYLQK